MSPAPPRYSLDELHSLYEAYCATLDDTERDSTYGTTLDAATNYIPPFLEFVETHAALRSAIALVQENGYVITKKEQENDPNND